MSAKPFYPFIDADGQHDEEVPQPTSPARIAVYDDMTMPPRVKIIEPCDIRSYLEQITASVYEFATQQGGEWSFSLIRELVENYIHAFFREPTVSILDKGQTITFSDQGPGIADKQAALKPSFSSATKAMKHYIRGVGSGLPIVEEQMKLKHGSIKIEDNLGCGTIVTVSLKQDDATVGNGSPAVESTFADPQGYAWQHRYTDPSQQTQPYPQQPDLTQPYRPQHSYQQQPYPYQGYTGEMPAVRQPLAQQGYTGAFPAVQQPYPQPGPGYTGNLPPVPPSYPQPGYTGGWPAVQQQYPQQGYTGEWPAVQQPLPQTGYTGGWPAVSQPYPQTPPGNGYAQPYSTSPYMMQRPPAGHELLSNDQEQILMIFSDLSKVGPSEVLERGLASSKPTATRRLQDLERAGMIMKAGQKYELTGEGRNRLDALLPHTWKVDGR